MNIERFGQRPAIDLTRHHFMRPIGDIVVFGTWIHNDDQEDSEPALVLLPRHRPPSSVIPCVIGLSAAYLYNDMKYLANAAKGIAKALGFEDSMMRTHKIADAIHTHLPDLVSMPVNPTETVVAAEATLDLGNGQRRTVQLLDHEQVKQV